MLSSAFCTQFHDFAHSIEAGAGFVEFLLELSVPMSDRGTKGETAKIRGVKQPPVDFLV